MNGKNRSKAVVSALILGAAAMFSGCGKSEPAAPPKTVTAVALTKAFADDKEAAGKKYANLFEPLTVQGEITEIDESGVMTTIHLKGHAEDAPKLQCTLDEGVSAANLKEGDNVKLTGVCSGDILGTILVVNCKIEK